MARITTVLTLLAALVALGACEGRGRAGEDCVSDRPTPSGFCVPRWLSLRSGEVLARRGPGFDYPALWMYRSRGLPVQVVAETAEWRRICDPDGGAVWVHRTMVGGRRMAMAPAGPAVPLTDKPGEGGKIVGWLGPRRTTPLEGCEDGWCRVKAGGRSAFAPESRLWGAAAAPQCR